MGNILKGILYTGIAGAIGAGGYLLGKYKYLGNKVSLTMIGLAFVLYAPKGCDVAETYIKERASVEKARIYGTAHKDSLDVIINSEKRRDSILYFKQFIQNASATNIQLEETYKNMINDNESRYKGLLQKNDVQYNKVLSGMIQQNDALKSDLEKLKTVTSRADSSSYADTVKDTGKRLAQGKIPSNGRKLVILYENR